MIKQKVLCLSITALVCLFIFSSNSPAAVGLISQSGGVLDAWPFDKTLGWSFGLNTEITLNRLGVFDEGQDGLAASHQVGLWTTGGTLIADATVPAGTAGSLFGDFRYVDVPSVALPVGVYVIGVHFDTAGRADQFLRDNSVLTTHPFVNYNVGRISSRPGFEFPPPTASGSLGNFTTGNFQFNIPEPSTCYLLLLASGLGLAVRRQLFCF